MVKAALSAALLCVFAFATPTNEQDAVLNKVRSILEQKRYKTNEAFIKIIFSPPQKFILQERVDVLKVIETLKQNGLLDLFFDKPTRIALEFQTNGTPLFFVKIVGDILRKIGYYRYVTDASRYNNSEFIWRVAIVSEYAADPTILQEELQKNGCKIVDISRKSPKEWHYVVDMRNARLDVETLQNGFEKQLKRSLYPYWFDVATIRKLRIISIGRNRWYPDISFYDAKLHLVKVIQRDRRMYDVTVRIPKNAKYIKISDIYTMKNIKDKMVLKPSGDR